MSGAGGAACRVATLEGARYVEQLAKHWSHRLEVERTGEAARITLPSGAVVTLRPEPETLAISIEAETQAALVEAQGVVAAHLDRFAFREGPLRYDWG